MNTKTGASTKKARQAKTLAATEAVTARPARKRDIGTAAQRSWQARKLVTSGWDWMVVSRAVRRGGGRRCVVRRVRGVLRMVGMAKGGEEVGVVVVRVSAEVLSRGVGVDAVVVDIVGLFEAGS